MKEMYVTWIQEKLIFKYFEKYKAPMGWTNINILIDRIENSNTVKLTFSKEELKAIYKNYAYNKIVLAVFDSDNNLIITTKDSIDVRAIDSKGKMLEALKLKVRNGKIVKEI